MHFDPHTIMNLVGQLGGDHQQAAQQLQGVDQVDPQQHANLLSGLGVDPRQLASGGYQQHLDAQQQPGFQGYQPGGDYSDQQPTFNTPSQDQGYGQQQSYGGQQGYDQDQGYDQQQSYGQDQSYGDQQGY